jgi:CheY-like chemotaxis protein
VDAHRQRLDAKRQQLTITLPDRDVTVLGDPVRLQQVLTNLVNNASKYTGEDGSIWLTLELEGDEAVVRVRDNGVGIPEDQLDSIFNLFAQANPTLARTEGGLGIGLTLVKRIVALHGGSVQSRSDGLGRGAEFIVRLPRDTAGGAAAASPVASLATAARRVLVIEDHDDGREVLVATLERHGHHVVHAAGGREGIDAALRCLPEVALIDIGLPDVDGYEVARTLRHRLEDRIWLVALTGYGQPQDRLRAEEAGFDAHLVKPIEPARLAEMLERLAPSPRV